MPSILNHQSAESTKLLFIGDSGTGKTGALASLVPAGYRLRIIDLDNGLDILSGYFTNPASMYLKAAIEAKIDLESALRFVTITEQMKNVAGRLVPAKATVWERTVKLLDHWKEPDGTDLGKVSSWTSQDVLVIDSFTMLSTAALNFQLMMNGRLGNAPEGNQWRRDVGVTQNLLESLLQLLYDSSIKCNVIVTSHITYVDESQGIPTVPGENAILKGYPSALGRALSPRIPRYFNNVLQAKTSGSGSATKHKIYTMPQGAVDLKSSAPLRVKSEYPLETGLADFFAAVRQR